MAWAAADLTREEDAETSFAAAAERFGRIDGLFAVVGASGRRFGDGPADAIPLEGWDRTLAINARPPFLAAREAIRLMQKQQPTESGSRGSVVLVSSVLAAHPSPKLFATHAYAAAKGAIISLTRAMASYYAPAGVRVNAVAPGLVETPMSHRAADDEATVTYAARKQPLAGGFLSPGDVAAAACFFLSDDSIRVTGQVLEVDGGWSVTEAPA